MGRMTSCAALTSSATENQPHPAMSTEPSGRPAAAMPRRMAFTIRAADSGGVIMGRLPSQTSPVSAR